MKTEERLKRQEAEEAETTVYGHHWPWLVPGRRAEYRMVTLFEGLIREDGIVIPI